MKPEEAIARLGKLRLPMKTEEDHKNHKAVRLGIEALQVVKDNRGYPEYIIPRQLPSETED